MKRQRIAIVGTGIAGLGAAWLLHRQHDITVFEMADHIGGHTATVDVRLGGRQYAVDTGFIVYNERTYPNFIRLLDTLGVAVRPTRMSFSVHCSSSGLEYCGSNLNGLFAQRRNLLRPAFWRLLADIVRFNRESVADLDAGRLRDDETLGAYLERNGYSNAFCDHYLIPMGAAIWSAGTGAMRDFPVLFFLRFFRNHGLLDLRNRPQWYTVTGGSRQYLKPLAAPFADRIRCRTVIEAVRRDSDAVRLRVQGQWQAFDQLVLACHSDQALALLADAGADERALLGAIPYQMNDVVLHTDTRLLPIRRRAWACWNYRVSADEQSQAVLTYDMNRLQGIEAPETFCVTLNDSDRIRPETVLGRYRYAHPVFTPAGMAAQQQLPRINGRQRTWFCGAWCRNGFHEDGLVSAMAVADGLGVSWP